jgi:hypothetical protein
MNDWENIDKYCSAGFFTLVVLSIIVFIVWLIPLKFWVILGLLGIAVLIMGLICYTLGRLVYWFMDRF